MLKMVIVHEVREYRIPVVARWSNADFYPVALRCCEEKEQGFLGLGIPEGRSGDL